MYWVLQNNIFNEDAFDELRNLLVRFEIPHSVHRVVPFVGTLLPETGEHDTSIDDPVLKNIHGPVICMGSYSMRHAAKKMGWQPGVFDLMETGNFIECTKRWGERMLNADSVISKFKDANWHGTRFIRPVDDSKHFAGTLMDDEAFTNWQYKVCELGEQDGSSLTGETLIQVANPKRIYTEYRCWIVKGEIITTSLYKIGDRVVYNNVDGGIGDIVREFANEMLEIGGLPAEAFCMDVCETAEGWRIVELNTLNSSGFYAADLMKLVDSLESRFTAPN